MNIRYFCSFIPTLGPIGYLPAPGTMGTIATIPLIYLLHAWLPNAVYGFLILIFILISYLVISYTLAYFPHAKDPQEIIIDEVVGCIITFWHVPLTFKTVVLGFLLFRLFDIAKFGWIDRVQKYPRAWGILLDDIVAGLFANVIMRILLLFFIL